MTLTSPLTTLNNLPKGFSYLEQHDASILQEIRYAGSHNFVGSPIDGYEEHKCVVSNAVGQALAKVQAALKPHQLSLKVYEAYRPLRAGAHFLKWALSSDDQTMKTEFYPAIEKNTLFDQGYIAFRSQHTRGCAVDVTLVPLPTPAQATYQPGDPVLDGRLPKGQRFDDNSIEMGTSFDCLDEMAHTHNPKISDEAKKNRAFLLEIMSAHGFENYSKEWWHFSLKQEPFPNMYFDFPIR